MTDFWGYARHMSIYPEREPIPDQSNNYTPVDLGETMRFLLGFLTGV